MQGRCNSMNEWLNMVPFRINRGMTSDYLHLFRIICNNMQKNKKRMQTLFVCVRAWVGVITTEVILCIMSVSATAHVTESAPSIVCPIWIGTRNRMQLTLHTFRAKSAFHPPSHIHLAEHTFAKILSAFRHPLQFVLDYKDSNQLIILQRRRSEKQIKHIRDHVCV